MIGSSRTEPPSSTTMTSIGPGVRAAAIDARHRASWDGRLCVGITMLMIVAPASSGIGALRLAVSASMARRSPAVT